MKSPHARKNIHQLAEDVLNRYDIKEKTFEVITDRWLRLIDLA